MLGWNSKPIVNLPICFVRADNENHWKSGEPQFGSEYCSSSPVFIFYLWLTISLLTTCFCSLLCHCYYLYSIINVHQGLKQWSINCNWVKMGQKSILAPKLLWALEKCCWKCNVNGRTCILERLDQTHMFELWLSLEQDLNFSRPVNSAVHGYQRWCHKPSSTFQPCALCRGEALIF